MTFDLPQASQGGRQAYMPGTTYQFDLPRGNRSIIKVIGVGGGGSNAVNHMFRMGIKDVEFIVCNTDAQALKTSPVPNRLQIGTALTEGLGCGANPEVGRAAAIESQDQIKEALAGTKMVFITAGMGGGTGTGAAPVIAKIAREMGILTVGIVTSPFDWEGKKKLAQADKGISGLRENCDTVLVILNSRLREMFGNLPIRNAFAEADNVLTTAAKGIAEIITLAGYVNVDFMDVRTVMKDAGAAVMGSAETRGEDRALNAARLALASPLLDNKDIMGAKRILLSIISGEEAELQMDELTQITDYIQEQAGERCEVIFGHGIDEALGNKIRVTVIATGFHDSRRKARKQERTVVSLDSPQPEAAIPVQPDAGEEIELMEEPVIEAVAQQPADYHGDAEPDFFADMEMEEKPEPAQNNPVESVTPVQTERTYVLDLFSQESEESPAEPQWLDPVKAEDVISLEYGVGQEIDLGTVQNSYPLSESENITNTEDEMEKNKTRERLEAQAQARRERLNAARRQEMSREEFDEKWNQPAFQRKGVRMENVPHSSSTNVSRFNINDDNNLLGNNKFLHDNVD